MRPFIIYYLKKNALQIYCIETIFVSPTCKDTVCMISKSPVMAR